MNWLRRWWLKRQGWEEYEGGWRHLISEHTGMMPIIDYDLVDGTKTTVWTKATQTTYEIKRDKK